MLKVQDIAKDLGVSTGVARPLIEMMRHLRVGRMVRVAPEDFAEWKLRGGRDAWISYLLDLVIPAQQAIDIPRPVVYFISNGDKFVKIGTTGNLKLRVDSLRCGSPFTLDISLALSGGIALERKLHERFATVRHRGEWFRRKGDLAKLLARAAA